ncbi:minor capsid protein [Aerococcaceae bacterium NML160702]|nr:minor capsid protein [Aerococcaceae bacterium NML160702]
MYDLPKDWFVHSVRYDVEESDSWKDSPSGPMSVEVTGVRISANDGVNITKDNQSDVSKAVMYVSPKYSSFNDFVKGNYVTYNGVRYRIAAIHRYTQPTSDVIHHWRLELV